MRPLTDEAFAILVTELGSHGNVLSDMHRAALLELVDTFSDYAEGKARGRKVFSLPTGMGKTSAVAAFVAAVHKLNTSTAIAVSASQVEALCCLKRELMRLGVPAAKIGLKHSLQNASEPSTANESRQFQLVTHARVRAKGGNDLALFGAHQGNPRALMVYDETLLRSDAVAVSAMELASAVGALAPRIKARDAGSPVALAHKYVSDCIAVIEATLKELRERGDAGGHGAAISLPLRDGDEIEAYKDAVRGIGLAPKYIEDIEDLLDLSQDPLRVLSTAQGKGLIWCEERIPQELRNVCVLDASHPVRMLAQADSSLDHIRSFDDNREGPLKSFEDVEVYQYLAGGGRDSITKSAGGFRREHSALSREVIDMVRENWASANGILIFTYNKRSLDIEDRLRRDLNSAGFDAKATGPAGQPRIQFLTWGKETSLNGYEHCDVVILAGVMQRSFLEIAAAIKGQKRNLAEPTPHDLVVDIVESEVAHLVYQAGSRGSCRRVVNGKALPMRLYFVHRDPDIRQRLSRVMPGASWECRIPNHLRAATVRRVEQGLAATLLAHLRTLPESVQKVSTRQIKAALGLAKDEAAKKAFTRAVQSITSRPAGEWALEGQSLVRGFARYFGEQPRTGT